jgi:tRNA A-37 threonylcarbamoyl transferase component Bud32
VTPDLTRLGKYEIRGVLGKGAMGIVYKAFDPQIERPVAIKTIRKDSLDADLLEQFMARFKNEARAAGRLTHANIVGIYDYGEDNAVAYIAMEYVEGTGLREYLDRRANFDFTQLVALMSQLLDALEFAHRCGVVHRDIKPSNLIVSDAGALKVADFGVAHIDMSNLTTAGMVIGTPSYMSPEQCMGEVADARSDVFSAGVVLYELLTGRRPFTGTVQAIAYKICHEEPVPPSTLSGLALPPAVDRLVATALAKRPEDRFPSARAFHEALREVAQLGVAVDGGEETVAIGTLLLHKPVSAWDDATLATAEHELAQYLGPMARVLVRRAAARTQDRGELCALLSENIDDPDTRRRFVDAFGRTGSGLRSGASGVRSGAQAGRSAAGRAAGSVAGWSVAGTGGGTGDGSAPGVPLDAAYVDQITSRLAVYLGPIARIVTRKAAQQTASRAEFVRMVAGNLGTQERAAFLRETGYADG